MPIVRFYLIMLFIEVKGLHEFKPKFRLICYSAINNKYRINSLYITNSNTFALLKIYSTTFVPIISLALAKLFHILIITVINF
jgi:hypothetical protein